MQVSATALGREYGLTAVEMNRALQKLGYLVKGLDGYELTEKALDFAVEKGHHRGTGGYSCYNAYWTTRTFDESIKAGLQITPELIEEVREELSLERAARYATQAAERAKANADFLAKQASESLPEVPERIVKGLDEDLVAKIKKAGILGITAVTVTLLAYGIYKLTPKVKAWWAEQKKSDSVGRTDTKADEKI